MAEQAKERLLRNRLQGEVDEALLSYVIANTSSVIYMPISRFCRETQVSEEEALAFFKAFGVDGFQGFKNFLRETLYYDIDKDRVIKRSPVSIAEEIIQYEMSNLTKLSNSLDYELLDTLAREILAAPEVVVLGQRASLPFTFYLSHLLTKLGIRVFRPDHRDGASEDYLSTLMPGTIVIAFGMSRYHKDSVIHLNALRQKGFHTVSITDYPESPFAMLSDYHFILPIRSYDFTDSYSAGMSFISILTFCIAMYNEKQLISRLNAYDTMAEEMNFFF